MTGLRARLRVEGLQILRILIAAAVSWQMCVWLGAQSPPIFAAVVPLVAMRDQPYSAFNLSFDRLIGVVAGVCLALLVVRWLGPSLPSVVLVLGVGLLAGVVLRLGTALNIQIGVTALLVFADAEHTTYALARLWETAVGAVVTVVLSPLLFPPNARRQFNAELQEVTDELVGQLEGLRARLSERIAAADLVGLAERASATEERARALPASYAAAQKAVRHNPLRRADREPLAGLADRVKLATELAREERWLLDDVANLSARDDLAEHWPFAARELALVLPPTVAAIRVALYPEHHWGEVALTVIDEMEAGILHWKAGDPHALSVVLRRPIRRMEIALRQCVQPASRPG
jgi:uncharacterized membrane protein YgaE (UPF0421/DUF939 family)